MLEIVAAWKEFSPTNSTKLAKSDSNFLPATLPKASLSAHADTFSSTSTSNSFSAPSSNSPTPTNRWCPPSTANIVRLPADNISTLQGQINSLTAVGATSINAGLKWGLASIDPESRSMFSEFVSSGAIDTPFDGHPYDHTDSEALKVIVLMTDGEQFAEERVNDAY